jgi:CheY-like chemotaxis protein
MGSVLVVDDDADSRDAVSRFLMRAGNTVRSARNGREALIAVATVVPDVIVLDVRMPEMNGMEFLQVIRSYLRWQNLPVILLTAYPDDLPLERAHELGVKMIFVKPNFRFDDLLECVNRLAADPAARCEGPRAAGA